MMCLKRNSELKSTSLRREFQMLMTIVLFAKDSSPYMRLDCTLLVQFRSVCSSAIHRKVFALQSANFWHAL